LAVTHLKVTNAREFLDEVVIEDFKEFEADATSLRKAFHCALSLYHLHEWVFASHATQLNYSKARDFDKALCASPDFQLIRDIANAAKHMVLTRDPKRIAHAANTAVQSTGWGEGNYGQGPYGGGPRVRVHVGPGDFEEFSTVARSVLEMWHQMFVLHSW
jgi:hypothetical protein